MLTPRHPAIIRVAAAGSLARLGELSKSSYELCVAAAGSPETLLKGTRPAPIDVYRLQERAAISLGWMNRPEAVESLHPLLRSPDGGVQVAAAMGILRLLSGYSPIAAALLPGEPGKPASGPTVSPTATRATEFPGLPAAAKPVVTRPVEPAAPPQTPVATKPAATRPAQPAAPPEPPATTKPAATRPVEPAAPPEPPATTKPAATRPVEPAAPPEPPATTKPATAAPTSAPAAPETRPTPPATQAEEGFVPVKPQAAPKPPKLHTAGGKD
jgi:hypothetical protein